MSNLITYTGNKCRLIMIALVTALVAAGVGHASTNLRPVEVLADRLPSTAAHQDHASFGSRLSTIPDLALISQGGPGSQNDFSIRGSSFSGAGLSLMGLSLRNPQTEHFHAELPFPSAILRAPSVLHGLQNTTTADGFLVGTLATDFRDVAERRLLATAGFGEVNRNWQSLLYQLPGHDTKPVPSVSVFAERETAEELDYDDNDLDRLLGGAHLQLNTANTRTDVAVSSQRKQFGARGYYGVTPAWAAEETIADTLVSAGSRWTDGENSFVRLAASWRQIEDNYILFWTLPGVYENDHLSTIFATAVDGRHMLGDHLDVDWRAGYDTETLDSSSLGNQDRRRAMAILQPGLTAGRCRLTAGVRAETFSDDVPAILPQAGLSCRLNPAVEVSVSYTEAARLPSFTELNYESPGSLGNQGLDRQSSRNLELACRVEGATTAGRATVFGRRSGNTVDWVRPEADSTRWEATDLGTVDVIGAELMLAWVAGPGTAFQLTHTALEKQDDVEVYAGRYVLDYPDHLSRLDMLWSPSPVFHLRLSQALQWQHDNPIRTGDDFGSPARISAQVSPAFLGAATLSLAIDNLWNDPFEARPGQPVSGRRGSAALTLPW